jgi:ABC-2 type transport system ATP-binding protein
VRALQGVDLTIPPGMFGLLGPNGAGKSSLMRTIATLQDPDSGTIRFGDLDVLRDKAAVRGLLGYLPQEFGLYPNLSAEAILDHFAILKGITSAASASAQVDALLEQTNLAAVRKKAVGGFSGGMKQRLGIAIALLGRPRLVIVDEPTAGLDPTERHRFLNLLGEIGEDVVVILSTHIVEDVAELCPNFAIIAGGRVLYTGAPEAVIATLRGKIWRRVCTRPSSPTYKNACASSPPASSPAAPSSTSTTRAAPAPTSSPSSPASRTCTSTTSPRPPPRPEGPREPAPQLRRLRAALPPAPPAHLRLHGDDVLLRLPVRRHRRSSASAASAARSPSTPRGRSTAS